MISIEFAIVVTPCLKRASDVRATPLALTVPIALISHCTSNLYAGVVFQIPTYHPEA